MSPWAWFAAAVIFAALVAGWLAWPRGGRRVCPRSAHGPVARVLAEHEQAEADIRRRDGTDEGGAA